MKKKTATEILFTTQKSLKEFYQELEINDEGMECLRLLNEIIADFDELIEHDEFDGIEKIKTIGSTYMAAAGLEETIEENRHDSSEGKHVVKLAIYAMRLQDQLEHVNVHSFNHFKERSYRFNFLTKVDLRLIFKNRISGTWVHV